MPGTHGCRGLKLGKRQAWTPLTTEGCGLTAWSKLPRSLAKVPHLRWSQAPPLPWRRPGSADYIVVYSYVILIPLQCAPFILYQDNGKPCLGHNIPYLIQMSLRVYSVFSCQAPGSFRHWPLGEVALLKVASSRSFSGATSLCRPGELSVRMLCICSLYNILYNRQNGDHQPDKGNCHICHRRGLGVFRPSHGPCLLGWVAQFGLLFGPYWCNCVQESGVEDLEGCSTHTNAETERLESCSWLLLAQVSIDLEQ